MKLGSLRPPLNVGYLEVPLDRAVISFDVDLHRDGDLGNADHRGLAAGIQHRSPALPAGVQTSSTRGMADFNRSAGRDGSRYAHAIPLRYTNKLLEQNIGQTSAARDL
jgi:hypothetical protein